MPQEHTLKEIIEGYRHTIYQRYQYQDIKDRYSIRESIDEETVHAIRDYFLDYIYPGYDRRMELNEAFKSLDSYIKQPEKLLRMLLDSGKLIFKHGRHLPKILNAGLKAMRSFRVATTFEDALVEEAISKNMEAPFDQTKINTLIRALSRKDIEGFLGSIQSLFEILYDRALLGKIIEILQYLIAIMRKKEGIYSSSEIRGLEIGLEMLKKGEALFHRLAKEDQEYVVQLIVRIETDTLDDIF